MNSMTFSSSSSALLFSHTSLAPSSNLSSSKTLISFSSSSSSFNGIGSIRRSASNSRFRPIYSSFSGDSGFNPDSGAESGTSFCIIEGPETVQDFVQMQLQEIQDNIRSRRNKIFLLMEEVRRLRVQQRIKSTEFIDENGDEDFEMPDIPSSIPFLPHMTKKTLKRLYLTSFSFISGVIVFGGLLAPTLELKLGLGGTTYEDFIRSMHLPLQLSQVDPIVASFSGGAVGVISALMLLEANNVEQQEKKRCKYCHGTGYLACARCSASGVVLSIEPISVSGNSDRPLHAPTTQRCLNCSGAGKVMCPTCLCTGMVMASEHDPRINPFD
ncbi:protein ORANGE, chloroplastic-like protein isoform X1 [Cinnamomum micranthum f. kanehirae]|uniref:Protein ORANGE, chloroplastic-like protein isoform X1 n=1 Tax=Cinnamomum micranthum f. kanehirae TaxID=337451 RepID=A0A443Q274_9MAGN|nr:protein ORANGE, chloroplastic-like protein isoform X1 [Cinnamomum micranthum f. kanehirae]